MLMDMAFTILILGALETGCMASITLIDITILITVHLITVIVLIDTIVHIDIIIIITETMIETVEERPTILLTEKIIE